VFTLQRAASLMVCYILIKTPA